jgi:hypothetical protein
LLNVRFALDNRRRVNKSDTIALEPAKFDGQRREARGRPRGLRAESEKEARWLQVPERRTHARRSRARLTVQRLEHVS